MMSKENSKDYSNTMLLITSKAVNKYTIIIAAMDPSSEPLQCQSTVSTE